VIDAKFAVRTAGYAVRRFGGLTYAQAKSRIPRVVVGGHNQVMAQGANVGQVENHVRRKLTLDREIEVLLVWSESDFTWTGVAVERV